jgi:L-2,4-diaminobutyrate decarboxylase
MSFYPDDDDAADEKSLDMEECSKSYLSKIFSSALFRRHIKIVVDQLASYLEDGSIRGLSMKKPNELLEEAKSLMAKQGSLADDFDAARFRAIIDLYICTGMQVYSPGCMGRQFSGVIPLSGIVDMVSAILNQPSSFYEAAQLPNVAEKLMANELNKYIGYEDGKFDMVTTSGGSLANLTALLAARNSKFPDSWTKGIAHCCKDGLPAVAVSEDIHYSVIRAAAILGVGENNIVWLPVNAQGKICAEKAPEILANARRRGLNVFCIAASAGTTSFGAFDPVDKLAQIAAEQDIWLHVDGAHGASLLISDAHRHKMAGISSADSFVWDAHKMMFVPSPCSLLFYKNKENSSRAFRQEASYVFEKYADEYTEYDSAGKNFECTKKPMIMNLWVLWAMYGRAAFSGKIELLCRFCLRAYNTLADADDFEALHSPESNILCFRYAPRNLQPGLIPGYQLEIRNRVRQNGLFFISKVDIRNETALRVVFMNHQIKMEHFQLLLNEIRQVGQEIIRRRGVANESGHLQHINKTKQATL